MHVNLTDLAISLACLGFATFMLVYGLEAWTDGEGLVSRRGRLEMGDSYFPTILVWGIAVLGLGLGLTALFKGPSPVPSPFTLGSLWFGLGLFAACALALSVTYVLAPLALLALGDADYRSLFLATPFRQLPFILGASLIPITMISLSERRVRWQTVALSFAVTTILALVYTLPFDDKALPPVKDLGDLPWV